MTEIASVGHADPLAQLRQLLAGNHAKGADAAIPADPGGDQNFAAPPTSGAASSSAATLPSSTAPPSAGTSVGALDPALLGLLIQHQEQSAPGTGSAQGHAYGRADFAQQIFPEIDGNGDGQISQSELESFFTANGGTAVQADALFAKLDPAGTGAVSESQFAAALRHGRGHHHHHGGAGDADPLAALLQGSSPAGGGQSQSTANADGSTTTTITYADGTTIALTVPAASAGAGASTGSADSASTAAGSSTGNPAGASIATSSSAGASGTGALGVPRPNSEQVLARLIELQAQLFQSAGSTSPTASA